VRVNGLASAPYGREERGFARLGSRQAVARGRDPRGEAGRHGRRM